MVSINNISLSCFDEYMEKNVYSYERERMNIPMKKIYCVECDKYRKFVNPKVSYLFNKT